MGQVLLRSPKAYLRLSGMKATPRGRRTVVHEGSLASLCQKRRTKKAPKQRNKIRSKRRKKNTKTEPGVVCCAKKREKLNDDFHEEKKSWCRLLCKKNEGISTMKQNQTKTTKLKTKKIKRTTMNKKKVCAFAAVRWDESEPFLQKTTKV